MAIPAARIAGSMLPSCPWVGPLMSVLSNRAGLARRTEWKVFSCAPPLQRRVITCATRTLRRVSVHAGAPGHARWLPAVFPVKVRQFNSSSTRRPSLLAHAARALRIVQQRHNCAGRGGRRMTRHNQAGFLMMDGIFDAARTSGDHRFPIGLRFHEYQTKTFHTPPLFLSRGQRKKIARLIQGRQRIFVHIARTMYLSPRYPTPAPWLRIPQGTAPRPTSTRCVFGWALENRRHRLHQGKVSLARHKTPYAQNHPCTAGSKPFAHGGDGQLIPAPARPARRGR